MSDVCTAWVAFSPSSLESGAMKVAPGTHKLEQLPHKDTFDPDNMLTRGQELGVEVDESSAVDMVLKAGEVSLHHVMLAHASSPNLSDDRRKDLVRRAERADSVREANSDPSGLPPYKSGGPGVHPVNAVAGAGYGEGFAGNAHRHMPDGWIPALKYLIETSASLLVSTTTSPPSPPRSSPH